MNTFPSVHFKICSNWGKPMFNQITSKQMEVGLYLQLQCQFDSFMMRKKGLKLNCRLKNLQKPFMCLMEVFRGSHSGNFKAVGLKLLDCFYIIEIFWSPTWNQCGDDSTNCRSWNSHLKVSAVEKFCVHEFKDVQVDLFERTYL